MIYFVLFIFTVCLTYAQFMISRFNLNARWSGFGAIPGVILRNSEAPMVYRVLVPWIVWLSGQGNQLVKYELCQLILIYLSLVSIYTTWNISIVFISMILLTVTFWYDYWDWTLEIIAASLALVSFPLSILSVTLLSLSRETAPIIGVIYYLRTGDKIGAITLFLLSLLVLGFIRLYQGEHKLYCQRWMILVNLELLKDLDIKAWFSVGLCTMGLLGSIHYPEFPAILFMVIIGWLMAKGNETRVFVITVPYAASWILSII